MNGSDKCHYPADTKSQYNSANSAKVWGKEGNMD